MEYCSVVYHSMLTNKKTNMLEPVQKVSLQVILGNLYENYTNALSVCALSTLYDRREKQVKDFSHKALKHPKHNKMFPLSDKFTNKTHDIRAPEKYVDNFGKTKAYTTSFIPYAQRMLNREYRKKPNYL